MKRIFQLLLTFCCLIIFSNVNAQYSGNQVYQNKASNYNRTPVETRSIYSTDSTLVITSKVLLNKSPEYYTITVGVNTIANTVAEANKTINEKIDKAINKIQKIGIIHTNIFVDFVSETKMYDHTITNNEINEVFDGFSIRKNIIVKTALLENIEKIIAACAEEEIYDIIKVDYVSKDLESINEEIFAEALKVIQNKKEKFVAHSSINLTDKYRIASESFQVYYPKNLYKQYDEAFETSLVNKYYNSSYIKKEARKERTFYYDGIETEVGVDKIIDDISPKIGIQYIIELSVVYNLNK